MKPMKQAFKVQKIKITESSKQKATKEANAILQSPTTTLKEKKVAEKTLQKIDIVEKALNMAMVNQAGGGSENNSGERMSLDVQRSFSSFFYNDELEEMEKRDSFWATADTVSIGKVKVRMDTCQETNSKFIYFRKLNSGYNPTLLKLSIYECEDFNSKLKALLSEIENTRPTEKIPFLSTAFADLDEKDADFFHNSVTISNLSETVKVRPFYGESKVLKFKFLSPRAPSPKFTNWPGPTFRLQSLLQFRAVVKYIDYCIETAKLEGIL